MRKLLNGDVIFGGVVLAVCIWFFIMGQQLADFSFSGGIDAGFFPRMLAIVVGLMAVLLIIQGIRYPESYFSKGTEKANVRMFAWTLLLFALYVGLWKLIHFIPLTIVFLLAESYVLKLSWKFAVIYSAIMSCGLFYLFAHVFKIILN